MQVLLTEEEYNLLKQKADRLDECLKALDETRDKLRKANDSYSKLLIYNVVTNNETLKSTLT